MGTLAEAVLTALRGFASEVGTWTNQGSLVSIAGHIAQVESAVAQDVHAGETAAKAVLADLYGAFHGHAPAETPAPVAPVAVPTPPAAPSVPVSTSSVSPAAPSPAPVADPSSVPASASSSTSVDPTAAPSITEASSAPSSETSIASSIATDTAAPAAQ